jgi:hypothetical protein
MRWLGVWSNGLSIPVRAKSDTALRVTAARQAVRGRRSIMKQRSSSSQMGSRRWFL